jgi:hypothetical protein
LNHVFRLGLEGKVTNTPHKNQNPSPQPVMETLKERKVTATWNMAKPLKHDPKPSAACI